MRLLLIHWRCALVLLLFLGMAGEGRAQLAITEVMSTTQSNYNTGFRGPDYWELTNFGTNEVNLDGYSFRDGRTTRFPVSAPFANLVIGAGETIVFFRVENANAPVTTPAQFRAWWGESKLPAGLRFRTWRSPGISGYVGDAIWLFDSLSNVVDVVEFGRGRVGSSFTYATETGQFGILSVPGQGGAFTAELAEDIGSPGITSGTVPLRLLQEPLDQSADAGAPASLTVSAAGVPRPRYQWFTGGMPIPGATGSILVISNVQPTDAGTYHVVIANGLSAVTSRVATLTVSTRPTPPTVIRPPDDVTVFHQQTAVFTVTARGYPAVQYQWQSNGVDIAGAISATLPVERVTQEMSGTRYSVRIGNELGSTNVSARLTVTRRPDLRFTEIMAFPAHENRHFDWFEVTNFDTNVVNLQGWRFFDKPSFADAFTISNTLTLKPGESVVFARRLTVEEFADWWGADHLPADLKFCTYSDFDLEDTGEVLYLWNAAATDPYDNAFTVSWAMATPAVSMECVHSCGTDGFCLDDGTLDSVPGVNGAFQAINGGDIGSPGYLANPPLRIISANRQAPGGIRVQCRVDVGKTYRLVRTSSLSAPAWTPLEMQTATNNVLTFTDSFPGGGPACFYRVEKVE